MTTVNIINYLKADKTNSTGKAPIYCKVTVEGKSATFSTGEWVFPARWKETNHLNNSRIKEEVDSLNEFKRIEAKIKDAKRIVLDREEEVTIETIMKEFKGETNSKTFSQLREHFLSNFKEKVAAELNEEATHEKYERVSRFFLKFLKEKYNLDDISLKKLKLEHIDNFDLYLRSSPKHKCGNNTTVKYCWAVGGIIEFGIKHDWLKTQHPFDNYGGKLQDVETVYLTDEELAKVENKDFENESLNTIKDHFLFSCYTSYAPCDVAKLEQSDVVKHIDGEKWIFTQREKTHIKSDVMLLPPALAIIEKYKNHPECIATGSLLPRRSNQKLNDYLKCICNMVGINKKITYYVSRHTFATTVTLNQGVPLTTVMSCMGHKRIATTQHYAKVLNLTVSNDLKKLKQDMEAKQDNIIPLQKQA